MKVFLALAAFVAVAAAEQCCWPEKFEARLGMGEGHTGPLVPLSQEMSDGRISFDYSTKKIATEMESKSNRQSYMINTLQDMNSKAMFIWSKTDEWCFRTAVPEYQTGDRPCFPMEYGEPTRTGDDKNFLELKGFSFAKNSTRGGYKGKLWVTPKQCIPASQGFLAKGLAGQGQVVYGQVYGDVSMGIKDMSVFDVPKICEGQAKAYNGPAEHAKTVEEHLNMHFAKVLP